MLIHYGDSEFTLRHFHMVIAIMHHNRMNYLGFVLLRCHVPLLVLPGREVGFCLTRGRALGGLLFCEVSRALGGTLFCLGGLVRSCLFCGWRAGGCAC